MSSAGHISVILCALLFAAMTAGAETTSDISIVYEWSNGTVAPQAFRLQRITFRSSGASEIRVARGKSATAANERLITFVPDAAKRKSLMEFIRSNQLDAPAPRSIEAAQTPLSRPGDGSCSVSFSVHGSVYGRSCDATGVPALRQMLRDLVPETVAQAAESDNPTMPALPLSFRGYIPDFVEIDGKLEADATFDLSILHQSIGGPIYGPATKHHGSWTYDGGEGRVTLHEEGHAATDGYLVLGSPSTKKGQFSWHGGSLVTVAWSSPAVATPTRQGPQPTLPANREIAIVTADGHYVTAANGGGFGGPNDGPLAVALHTDARRPGSWEHFRLAWLNDSRTQFALQTTRGTYVTAVGGGGKGGTNDGRNPVHTDAATPGLDELFTVASFPDGTVTLRTRKGYYLTAVNGGGYVGDQSALFRTDATVAGPWETFHLVDRTQRKMWQE